MTPRLISIAVLSRGRPAGFARAVRSAFAQRGHRCAIEIIGVDADPAGASVACAPALQAEACAPFVVRHAPLAPRAAVYAHALAMARGEAIAFLDDFSEAPSRWLAALIGHASPRAFVFGPEQAAPGATWRTQRGRAAIASLLSTPPTGSHAAPWPTRGAGLLVAKPAALAALEAVGAGPWSDLDPIALGLARVGAQSRFAPSAVLIRHPAEGEHAIGGAFAATVRAAQARRRIALAAGAPALSVAERARAGLAASVAPIAWLMALAGHRAAPALLTAAADGLGRLAPAPGQRPAVRRRRVPTASEGAVIVASAPHRVSAEACAGGA